jgi:uncharacterized protein YecE (DUF72 family)
VYYSSYAQPYLAQLACYMRVHAAAGREVWTMFDNTASGAALPNALEVALRLAPPADLQAGSAW